LNIKNPNYSFWGNNATSNTATTATGSNNMTNRIFSGYASAKTQQVIGAGGAYAFGPATSASRTATSSSRIWARRAVSA
jgi:hypothetical protein